MSRTSTPVAGGTTGSLADAAPAIDRIASVDYQMMKLADATTDATTGIGIDANPLKVKNRRRGTSDYDTGISAVPASATQVTASTTYLERILLTNITAAQHTFSLTDAADAEVISQYPVGPRMSVVLDLGGMALAGIKWSADQALAIRAQILGAQ